ncbi:MAG TPA: regulatory protein RecX [Candidatus Limnocylindrales bacterium]|jgi:regulatory protein
MAGRRTPGAHRASLAERRERRAAVEDPAVVLDAAAAFLAVRPRSIGETRRRLQTLGYRAALIDHVIERLTAYGYLDDAAFGRAWLESRDRSRPRGSHALRSELLAKGLERELVATLLAERDGEGLVDDADASGSEVPEGGPDLAAARRLLSRRRAALARELDPRRRRQRAYALLARGGFDPDVIRQALATALEPDADPDPEVGP